MTAGHDERRHMKERRKEEDVVKFFPDPADLKLGGVGPERCKDS